MSDIEVAGLTSKLCKTPMKKHTGASYSFADSCKKIVIPQIKKKK